MALVGVMKARLHCQQVPGTYGCLPNVRFPFASEETTIAVDGSAAERDDLVLPEAPLGCCFSSLVDERPAAK